jgi:glutamate-1-semialdehyde aminotransferase
LEPPALSEDNFKQKYPSAEAMTVVTLNMGNGQNITCTLVDNKVFLSTGNKVTVFGAGTTNAKPLFMYAGGTWISEDAKAMKEKNRLNTF